MIKASKNENVDLYKDFVCLAEQNMTNSEIMKALKIGQYKCEQFFTRYLLNKNTERENKISKAKIKIQNIQDGFHPWISRILRVS